MVLQDCYEIATEVIRQKVIPLVQSWGLRVVEGGFKKEGGLLYSWRITDAEDDRYLTVEVEKYNTFIRLRGNSRRLSIYPEEVQTEEEMRERAWNFFRRSLEYFVTELVWVRTPHYWKRKGRRLFRRRPSTLLDLTFTLGKRFWKWEIEQVIYPNRGYAELQRLGVVRCPAHQDPVAAGVGIISVEGLAYL
jgi:hypothetical protein